ncbi:PAS domain S-box-containing protein [Frankineae bacterium MT45]|nr:PAS domain S-box-containing protein [Frankineae bacterium MT45]
MTEDDQLRAAELLESMPASFVSVDREWRLTFLNAEAERIGGARRDGILGRSLWEIFPTALATAYETNLRQVMESGEPATFEAAGPEGSWFEIRAWPTPAGLSIYIRDVTERHLAESLVQLTAHAGELASHLDTEAAVTELARIVVPTLGDWSIVSVVDPDGSLRDVASWHVDPQLRPAVELYAATRFEGRDEQGPMGVALESTAPVVSSSGVLDLALAALRSPEARAAITALAPESSAALPLTASGRVAGVLSICRGADRPPLSAQELSIAASIAARAGLALDNARLYNEQRELAERLHDANRRLLELARHEHGVARSLQDAMLTRLPEPDHLHLTARYLTASEVDQVGGDWYDAVILPSGRTVLMIGDVVGHDIGAAAVMGQLRNMLRALAWDRDEPPSQIVKRLDRAIRDLKVATLATMAMVQVEQDATDAALGMRTLRWSNAGHPPPILVHDDGRVVVLDGPPDVLLGVDPTRPRNDHEAAAPPDSTLLLYTDGLTERRDRDLDTGQAQLVAALQRHHELELDEMLDATISDMVGAQPADDVAVLAVRFHDPARPRPAEAGPRHD